MSKPTRLFYITKLSSSLLKQYKYNLDTFENWKVTHTTDYDGTKVDNISEARKQQIRFNECLRSGLIISLSDSQMLKTVRDITGQEIDRDKLEEWYTERDWIKKRKNSKQNKIRIQQLQQNIYDMMYLPQYITVVMESVKDYETMYKKGFVFNGRTYKRMSCSASQARVSTIVFVDETIKEELKTRLDCGRDVSHPLAATKYNAYFGLYSSASKKVTKPRFCIVPDYCSNQDVKVNWSIETDWDIDDIVEERIVDTEFNRWDGCGIISPQLAEQWGRDLGEEYTPCQFVIRCAFTKGLVNEFDFVEWCRDELEGIKPEEEKYLITDIYGKQRDLREIDVILTEGMAKLWDSWESQESFEENCEKNGIDWRVTKYTPEKDKECSTMNYQYVQTLNLDDEAIKGLCDETVKYIQGVSYSDIYYTLLFLLGEHMDETNIEKFMKSSDNYWLKSLILNHNLLNDKYTKEKIRDMIVKRIELACLGRLMVRGNYQFLVADNYGLMQWITGQEVTGLLEDGEFYSKFWEDRGVKEIACARSPQTWRAEWQIEKNGVC